jgi:transposase-like protein
MTELGKYTEVLRITEAVMSQKWRWLLLHCPACMHSLIGIGVGQAEGVQRFVLEEHLNFPAAKDIR